jgi:hypothetical protein
MRTALVATGSAVAIAAGGAAIALPAAASGSTHTLKFTAVELKQASFSKTNFGQAEKDVLNGKVIGFDIVYFHYNSKTKVVRGGVTFETNGGVLYATLKFEKNTASGKVTGGTGKFQGATGTVVGTNVNKAGTRTAVTVTYR